MNYKNILVIQTAFIGDAILASSLLEKLHAHFPEADVSILVRKGNEGIYKNHPYLKTVLIWNKTQQKFKNLFKLLFQIRASKFDLVVNCHRYASSGFLTAFSGAHHKAGYKQTPFGYMLDYAPKHVIGDGKHEIERYNLLIEDFASKEVSKPKLYPSTEDMELVSIYKKETYVCIAPSSVWYTKQLPIDKWIALCNVLPSQYPIYVLGTDADSDMAEKIKSSSTHPSIISVCGKLSLLQSAALIKDAKMNYVNDSAPLHLASATNAPVTAFYCSTIKEFGFYPLSDNSKIIDVGNLECRPCGLHGFKACPKGHFNCGNLVDVQAAVIS